MRLAILAIAALLFASCETGPAAAPTIGKWEQTWPAAYGETTCAQWVADMNSHERFVAAGDMLLRAQRRDVPDAGIPQDAQVAEFLSTIDSICHETNTPTMNITEAAAVTYVTYQDEFSPE